MDSNQKELFGALNCNNISIQCPPIGQTFTELFYNLEIIQQLNPKIIVEIGSGTGGHICAISNVLDFNLPRIFITIDIWEKGTKYFEQLTTYKSTINKLKNTYRSNEYIVIKKPSQSNDAISKLISILNTHAKLIDYIFIDGSHKESDVKQDFLNFKDLVNDNGIICFHDIIAKEGVRNIWKKIKHEYSSQYYSAEIIYKGIPLHPHVKGKIILGLGYLYKTKLNANIKKLLMDRSSKRIIR